VLFRSTTFPRLQYFPLALPSSENDSMDSGCPPRFKRSCCTPLLRCRLFPPPLLLFPQDDVEGCRARSLLPPLFTTCFYDNVLIAKVTQPTELWLVTLLHPPFPFFFGCPELLHSTSTPTVCFLPFPDLFCELPVHPQPIFTFLPQARPPAALYKFILSPFKFPPTMSCVPCHTLLTSMF